MTVLESINSDLRAGFFGHYRLVAELDDNRLLLEHPLTGEQFVIADPRPHQPTRDEIRSKVIQEYNRRMRRIVDQQKDEDKI